MKAESRETESRQSAAPQTRKEFKLDRIKYPILYRETFRYMRERWPGLPLTLPLNPFL